MRTRVVSQMSNKPKCPPLQRHLHLSFNLFRGLDLLCGLDLGGMSFEGQGGAALGFDEGELFCESRGIMSGEEMTAEAFGMPEQ